MCVSLPLPQSSGFTSKDLEISCIASVFFDGHAYKTHLPCSSNFGKGDLKVGVLGIECRGVLFQNR